MNAFLLVVSMQIKQFTLINQVRNRMLKVSIG